MALPLRDDHPSRRVPWMTYALILTCSVVFLFIQPAAFQSGRVGRDLRATRFEYRWSVVPCEITTGTPLAKAPHCDDSDVTPTETSLVTSRSKDVWLALLTAMFLHGGVEHLVGNMLFLWVFGRSVENRVGPWVFLALYLVTGVLASFGHIAGHAYDPEPVLGASGAIAGIMGASLVFRPRNRILAILAAPIPQLIYVPSFVILALFFVTQFVTPNSEHVAWQAHVAGMVAGALLAIPLSMAFKERRG